MANEQSRIRANRYARSAKGKAQARRWHAEHPSYAARQSAAYRKAYPEKYQQYKRTQTLKRYGLAEDDFVALLIDQDFKCAICDQPLDCAADTCVDHDHETGRVRSLLCRQCNMGLGLFAESAPRLRLAAAYLEKHGSR